MKNNNTEPRQHETGAGTGVALSPVISEQGKHDRGSVSNKETL